MRWKHNRNQQNYSFKKIMLIYNDFSEYLRNFRENSGFSNEKCTLFVRCTDYSGPPVRLQKVF